MKTLEEIKSQFKECTSVSQTFFIGAIVADYSDLVAVFGEPTYLNGDKTLAEWCLVFTDGTIATIYDWKNYGMLKESIRHWHIGGYGAEALNKVTSTIMNYHSLVINQTI